MRDGAKINDCAFLADWVVVGTDVHGLSGEPITTLLGACQLHVGAIAQWSSLPGHPALVAEISALPAICEDLWEHGEEADIWTIERRAAASG